MVFDRISIYIYL